MQTRQQTLDSRGFDTNPNLPPSRRQRPNYVQILHVKILF